MTPYYNEDGVTIYHGDCQELLSSLEFDVVATDPPYGIGANKMQLGNRPKWRRLERGERDWDSGVPDLTSLVADVPAVIWGGNHFVLPPSRGWLVWDKKNEGMSFADCELAWTSLDMPIRKITHKWAGATAREDHEERVHPTQKPVVVMRWCLGFLEPGIVLDPYAGSGSTLIAARDLGRPAVGIEIEERYCEMAALRLSQAVLEIEPSVILAPAARFDLEGDG